MKTQCKHHWRLVIEQRKKEMKEEKGVDNNLQQKICL